MRVVTCVSRGLFFTVLLAWSLQVSAALSLRIELNPNPVRPAEVLLAQLTVTNDGAAPVTGVTLEAQGPADDDWSPRFPEAPVP